MALITELKKGFKYRMSIHKEISCRYFIINDKAGKQYLQIETDGSKDRQMPGKFSQSIQFSPEAVKQLKELLSKEFPE